MDLKCNKLNCVYNDNFACKSRSIDVADTTECLTYEKDEEKKTVQNVPDTMFETTPKVSPFRHKNKIGIYCEADCIFQKSNYCTANGITVLNAQREGICGTFIKK